jgi:hypothetical protein
VQQDQFPYLRNISIQYQKHLGGYMGGGSWEIHTTMDANGDKAKIIVSRGTSYRSHGDIIRFQILEPNLEILQNQWIFFRGIKRFPDKWRRNNNFGYNSVLTVHFEQFKGRFERPLCWDKIEIQSRLSEKVFTTKKTELGGWTEWYIK